MSRRGPNPIHERDAERLRIEIRGAKEMARQAELVTPFVESEVWTGFLLPMLEADIRRFQEHDCWKAESWDEYLEKMTWGHAYPEYAASLCEAADAGTLYLFHHSPDADDAQLDALAEAWSERRQPGVLLAKEGLEVDLEG